MINTRAWIVASLLTATPAVAATLSVGPGKTYPKPCAAFAAATDGDTIEIDAGGSYDGDVCTISKSKLTIRGVGGRPHVDAAGKNAGGKAIWVVSGSDTVIEDVELSGATVPDKNGAAIRQEGTNLTLRRVYFHDNEDGILAGADAKSTILIEYSEFARNGFGDGYSHNLYIGEVGKLVFRHNYSHHAKIGHELKTRAHENHILYNRLMNEADGTASYEIDVSQGGTTYVIGNLIQQGPKTDNSVMVSYAAEGAKNPGTDLYVVNNTFVNDKGSGTFVRVASVSTPAVIKNNVFMGGGKAFDQPMAAAVAASNFEGDAMLVDRAAFDFHLKAGSPAINAGADPGMGGGVSLVPTFQYVHEAMAEARTSVGVIDIGAYEFGGGGGAADGGATDGGGGDGSSPPKGDGANDGGAPDAAGDQSRDIVETGDRPGDGATGAGGGGCGCRVGGGSPHGALVLLLASMLVARRGRRSGRALPVSDPEHP